jgi:hypothetical protein
MIKIIYELTEILGEKWLEKNILEKYLKLAGSTNYLFRETFLFFIQVFIKIIKHFQSKNRK